MSPVPAEMSTVTAVAMSGGLDSSVVAWMLSRRPDPVVGLSMLLWDRSEESTHGRCCGALDLGDARRVADQCGIPHYTLRMDEEFERQVVDPFVDDYLAGKTPVPCTRCNTFIKFDLFLERARALGAGRIATGHYARILEGDDGLELHRAKHEAKDQSYYLFELDQRQLAAAQFPLGELSKEQVRDLAREVSLAVAEKPESMELCFVSGKIAEFVERRVAENPQRFASVAAGGATRLVDRSGADRGAAGPYYGYTVGQRKGLGIAAPSPLYVLEIEPAENRVVVGGEEELLAPGLSGERVHWIGSEPSGEVEAVVKIRSRHPGVTSRIRTLPDRRVELEFAEPQRGVAPGQAAVFYDGTRVLGGCWISRPQAD